MIAFAEVAFDRPCPLRSDVGPAELVRLYVQSPFQAQGVGSALLLRAERLAMQRGIHALWLSAWSGNSRALRFYGSLGYSDIGAMNHVIEGQAYENRVFAKALSSTNAL